MAIKVTTVRLEEELADELAAVARVDGMSVSDAVRGAVRKHVAERRAEPGFQARLKKRAEADRQIFESLVVSPAAGLPDSLGSEGDREN